MTRSENVTRRAAVLLVTAALSIPLIVPAQAQTVRDHRLPYGQPSQGGGVTVTNSGPPHACGKTIACGGGTSNLPSNVHDHRK